MDPTDHVKLSCDPPRHCDVHRSAVAPPGASSDIAVDGQGVPISCTLELKIAYQGSYPIRTLQIAVDAGPGFIAERNIFVIHNFGTGTTVSPPSGRTNRTVSTDWRIIVRCPDSHLRQSIAATAQRSRSGMTNVT